MAGRRLSPDEQARWAEVARTVRALRGGADPSPPSSPSADAAPPSPKMENALTRAAPQQRHLPSPRSPVPVLDGSWEKRVRGGTLVPDMAIDLHGHSLAAAHLQLDRALAKAVASGARTLLVVTGKPRKREDNFSQGQRGAIRSEIGHWIQTSPHADAIASVRVAHPRHGGDGALYVILRRKK